MGKRQVKKKLIKALGSFCAPPTVQANIKDAV